MAIELAATEYGEGTPVVILHGLFGSGRNWRSIAQRLAAPRLFPQARIMRIKCAGHWVHAEETEAFLQAVGPFLSGTPYI